MTDLKKKTALEEAMDGLIVDPDSPENHPSKKSPQTIENGDTDEEE
ncbi:hypothetical protein ACM61V_10825 [Sphingomonas sp. TX0543]|nr:hypothetical protein [Sphingomonas sp. 3P27F8]